MELIFKRSTALILSLLVYSMIPYAVSEPIKGFLDVAHCDVFSGWTCNGDDPARPLDVYFYADGPAGGGGTLIGSVSADLGREAAVGSLCGGYADHGFQFYTPVGLKDGRQHNVSAYAIVSINGSKTLLGTKGLDNCNGCQSQCSSGGNQCYGTGGYRQCSDVNADGCLELSQVAYCAAGQVCANGTCISANSTEKRLDLNASALVAEKGFWKNMFFFPFPVNEQDNILGLSGSVSLTASTATTANLLTLVGYIPRDCPVNGSGGVFDSWQALGQAYPDAHTMFAYILKTFNSGSVSTPTEFRLAKKNACERMHLRSLGRGRCRNRGPGLIGKSYLLDI